MGVNSQAGPTLCERFTTRIGRAAKNYPVMLDASPLTRRPSRCGGPHPYRTGLTSRSMRSSLDFASGIGGRLTQILLKSSSANRCKAGCRT